MELLGSWPVKSFSCFVLNLETGSVDTYGDRARPFKWASVSKLASSLAFLSAVSEGVFGLDEALQNGLVVSDLLAHASGLPTELDPAVGVLAQQPTLPPRTRRVYSNAGFELLATSFEIISGLEFGDYLSEVLFAVATMNSATVSGDFWPSAGRSGAAAGILGNIQDLLGLATALVSGTPFIDEELLSLAKEPYLPDLPGILPGFGEMPQNSWGLGLEVKGEKQPHWTSKLNAPATYGHFGAAGTFLWIDPVRQLALGVLTDGGFGPWAQKAWPELSSYVLQAY